MIRGHNLRQKAYLCSIRDNDISFGIGPAGTGKTYLAVACAVHALAENEIERIPAWFAPPSKRVKNSVSCLEISDRKSIPILRPLFDALYEMLGFDRVGKLIARGTIELAPLAYMRGRTLNDSFVILDEAQNSTVEQMKMFLTRIGFGSKAIITGDITQVDLPRGQLSGLRHSQNVLVGIKGISFTHFKTSGRGSTPPGPENRGSLRKQQQPGIISMAVDLQLAVSDSQALLSLGQIDHRIESWVAATLAAAARGDLEPDCSRR